MAGIVFYFEDNDTDVWSGRRIDLDVWNYNCKIGGITKAIVVNKTSEDLITFDSNMDVTFMDNMPTLSGTVAQLVTPTEVSGTTSLWEFDHQVDWYVFGPAGGWGGNHFGDILLTIPETTSVYHHSVFVGATIMFHRDSIINDL